MSDEDRIPTEADEGPVIDRRRERRVQFTSRCLLNVLSPSWAMTQDQLPGGTEDITANGMKINLEGIDVSQAIAWKEGTFGETELKVSITLPELPDFPTLSGQIVWVHPEIVTGSENSVKCSVGILFSVMKEKELQELLNLIDSL